MSIIEKALAKQQQKNTDTSGYIGQPSPQEQVKKDTTDLGPKEVLALDKIGLAQRGYLIDNGTRESIKNEFRQIKRKLLNNAFGNAAKTLHHSNLIMVSSAKPNEGKTFVAINLALSIALEQDKAVLLIDADVLRPSVVRELGVKENPGIIDYLLGDSERVSDIIYDTDIDKLKLIPAGKPHHLSNELLASEKMANFASELANRYPDRIVIFDCPPLIGTTETLVLANLMGQALIVVEESKTSIADVKAATEHLNEDLALGIVLNKAIKSHKDLYGYYGYGYGEKN
ncbi:tyrosine-protein kinase family protein [Colwellia sp. MB3u-70]|uniref:XrtA-associated tyrosine autokinase n=1 Tax=unclassified Colwellia TaxID=196834 RepID=UPI0015F407C4|nr:MULTISPECIES: XrtA-associated tyrosine autokinase [unclassified Colwellia]MBA6294089.1 tyrosine-protein kinase family protein [Colwellia sp. MB3u-8]MBA6307630.1 tyrosine-protein kinase family protein [Colwellia sp. MB3u-70]